MSPPPPRRLTRSEQREATRAVLVATARRLFGARGYAEVSTTDIVEGAEVTRGALYHHFQSKQDLFAAAFQAQEADMLAAIAAVAAQAQGWARVEASVRAFLDACEDEAVRRIVFTDAPAVLGWRAWRDHGGEGVQRLTVALLGAAMAEGVLRPGDPDALAVLLLGAMNEAGLALAAADDAVAARRALEVALLELLGGLRA